MKRLSLAFLFSIFVVGCSNPLGQGASVVDGTYGPGPSQNNLASGLDVIAGSSQAGATVSGRTAQVSAGNSLSSIRVTTSNGRTAFLNIQGQLIAQ